MEIIEKRYKIIVVVKVHFSCKLEKKRLMKVWRASKEETIGFLKSEATGK